MARVETPKALASSGTVMVLFSMINAKIFPEPFPVLFPVLFPELFSKIIFFEVLNASLKQNSGGFVSSHREAIARNFNNDRVAKGGCGR